MKTKQYKNSIIKKIIAATLLSAITLTSSNAIANSPNIDQKQLNQRNRIVQGFYSDTLTANEVRRLARQQRRAHRKERRFKSDGHFSYRERANLHLNLASTSRNIYRQKHNRQLQYRRSIRSFRINQRQHRQGKRIAQGVRSGALVRDEALKLGQQQARIQRQKRHYKADGIFTRKERMRIHRKQNTASRNIYRKKHNGRRR